VSKEQCCAIDPFALELALFVVLRNSSAANASFEKSAPDGPTVSGYFYVKRFYIFFIARDTVMSIVKLNCIRNIIYNLRSVQTKDLE
jgi:hypothetical protein